MGACGDRLGDIARVLDAAVGNDGYVRPVGGLDALGDGRDLRDAGTRYDSRGADRSGPDADLDGIYVVADEIPGRLGGGDIADDQLRVGKFPP